MLSLYIHIPFCVKNCPYCSFSVVQNPNDEMIQNYLKNLHDEINQWGKIFGKAEIRTIYFGGGTPSLIGSEEIEKLIHHCEEIFDCENIGELSFECNPFPQDQVYEFVSELQKSFKKYPRVRFSFGIQSLDNGVLENAGRPYTFPGMVDFLRGLRDLKQDNSVFNFDFMAFGIFNQTKKGELQLWTPSALEFFQDFVNSGFADSFSLYMLELFEHQKWKKNPDGNPALPNQSGLFGNEDEIYEEFDILKNIILEGGYKRYEISNFSAVGKSSIHNRVYREMEDYLGLGLSASSFINARSQYLGAVVEKLASLIKGGGEQSEPVGLKIRNLKIPPTPLNKGGNPKDGGIVPLTEGRQNKASEGLDGIRRTNTPYFPKYIGNEKLPESAVQSLSHSDYLIESFFLSLRTDRGIDDIEKFKSVLVSDCSEKIKLYEENGFLKLRENGFVLTDEGMDCYNGIITELLSEV